MIAVRGVAAGPSEASFLGRASPLAKLLIAGVWLVGLAFTLRLAPPAALASIALLAGIVLGRVPSRTLAMTLLPLWVAALGVAGFNAAFSSLNADPARAALAVVGPIRLTGAGLEAGVALGLRVLAIAAVGAVFGLTTDATRLVDALVQRAHVPDRFGYGALAAFQAIPRLAGDLTALREARRIHGLQASWHPRILIGLLVLAIRHAERLAVAMDARGFAGGRPTCFREEHWTTDDTSLVLSSVIVLLGVLAIAA